MAIPIRQFTIRIDALAQSAVDDDFALLANAIKFFRGETLRITFLIFENKALIDLTGNTFQLILKNPQDVQFGILAFTDTEISADLPNGTFTLELNANTGEMNDFVNFTTNLKIFTWELTAFVGVTQDRKLAIATGQVTSDVNQCIEGLTAIANQIGNKIRVQPSASTNMKSTGISRILSLVPFNALKSDSIDIYVESFDTITTDATFSIGTDQNDQLLIPTTALLATAQGEVLSFDVLNSDAIINENLVSSATEVILTVKTIAVGTALSVIPVLRGSRFIDNDPCP